MPDQIQYLGSDLHISQGLEVEGWQLHEREVHLRLSLPRKASGAFELAIPLSPLHALQDGHPMNWQPAADGTYRFPLDFEGVTIIDLDY
jgi:hypothetical protein